MQAIIGRAEGGGEGSATFFATVAPTPALRGDVKGVSNDVAFAELSIEGARGVRTGAIWDRVRTLLHTCLMSEKAERRSES